MLSSKTLQDFKLLSNEFRLITTKDPDLRTVSFFGRWKGIHQLVTLKTKTSASLHVFESPISTRERLLHLDICRKEQFRASGNLASKSVKQHDIEKIQRNARFSHFV